MIEMDYFHSSRSECLSLPQFSWFLYLQLRLEIHAHGILLVSPLPFH